MRERRRFKVVIPRVGRIALAQEVLGKAGCEVVVGSRRWFENNPYAADELIEVIADADVALVSPWEAFDRKVLEACNKLQAVVCSVIGVDRIDMRGATALGVLVCNSPAPENFIGLAEAAVGLIVALLKKVKVNEAALRQGEGYQVCNRGVLISGKVIGLIGLGRVGREVVKLLRAWNVRLIAHDPYVDAGQAAQLGVEMMGLNQLLREADVVSIHTPLTDETRHLITLDQLRMMKASAYIVNTARGAVIKEDDLVRALKERIIAGAALDVFEQEPLPAANALREIDPRILILTPHIIGHDINVEEPCYRMAVNTILAIRSGQAPETVLNPAAIDRWKARFRGHAGMRSSKRAI